MADDGIGIAPEDHERIFERFFQVDSTSTRKYNGSGLGSGSRAGVCRRAGLRRVGGKRVGPGKHVRHHHTARRDRRLRECGARSGARPRKDLPCTK
ncbi:MAG: ATP-binding protein [Gordonibacter pamelaeae]